MVISIPLDEIKAASQLQILVGKIFAIPALKISAEKNNLIFNYDFLGKEEETLIHQLIYKIAFHFGHKISYYLDNEEFLFSYFYKNKKQHIIVDKEFLTLNDEENDYTLITDELPDEGFYNNVKEMSDVIFEDLIHKFYQISI